MRKRDLRFTSGFTLLEVLVALTVLAVGAAVAISLLSGAMGNIRKAHLRTKLIGHAKSVMETALLDDTILTASVLDGQFDDGTSWTVSIDPITPELPASLQNAPTQNLQFQLLQYTVDMISNDPSVPNYKIQTLKLTKSNSNTTTATQ
jgi:prepilin-type N-terminal cleavage/methylation domain-containing protein